MLDFAAQKWQELDPQPSFFNGNMVAFTAPRKVDFAYVMLGSLYLNSLEERTSNFDSMAACLRPGALYFLDLCVQFNNPMTPEIGNSVVQEQGGIKVESRIDARLIDSAKQIYREVWTLDVQDQGRHQCLEMVEQNQAIYPIEFRLFLENRDDFEFVGWWRDWDLGLPVDGEDKVHRPIVIIRRK